MCCGVGDGATCLLASAAAQQRPACLTTHHPPHRHPTPLQKEEAEAQAAEAAEAQRLEDEADDPDVRSIRALLEAGRSSKTVSAAVADLAVKGPAQRMRVLYEALFGRLPADAKLAPLLAERKKLLKAAAPVRGGCGVLAAGRWRLLGLRGNRRCLWQLRLAHPQPSTSPPPPARLPTHRSCYPQDPAHQLAQLVALEHLLAVRLPGRVREAPLAYKALYDEECVPEPLILAWCAAVGGSVEGCPGGGWTGDRMLGLL